MTQRNNYLIADLHLGHAKLVDGFNPETGFGPRHGAHGITSIEEHDEMIIDRWNKTVRPQDNAYILGDVALSKAGLAKVARLNGHKRIIFGNHDQDDKKTYSAYFEKLCGAKTLSGGFVLTHIPIHPSCLNRRTMRVNIHGHTHEAKVPQYNANGPDPRYVCVSAEQVNYTPIDLDVIRERVKEILT